MYEECFRVWYENIIECVSQLISLPSLTCPSQQRAVPYSPPIRPNESLPTWYHSLELHQLNILQLQCFQNCTFQIYMAKKSTFNLLSKTMSVRLKAFRKPSVCVFVIVCYNMCLFVCMFAYSFVFLYVCVCVFTCMCVCVF